MAKVAAGAPEGGLPEKLDFESRLVDQAVRLKGTDVVVALGAKTMNQEYRDALGVPPTTDSGELVVELDAPDFNTACERAGPMFDRLLDELMFKMQAPIGLGQLNAVDVTPPRRVGEERDFWMFASYPFDRYARTVGVGATRAETVPRLSEAYVEIPDAARAALRWYTKSLETQFAHDAFMFLWIAMESLVNATGHAVTGFYKADCGHEIPVCPTCGKSTARKIAGATLRDYMIECGVDPRDAADLWKLRQMMHGAIGFDSERLGRLAELLQILRAFVAALLKDAQGIAHDEPPLVGFGAVAIHPAMGLGGHGALTAEDVADLIT